MTIWQCGYVGFAVAGVGARASEEGGRGDATASGDGDGASGGVNPLAVTYLNRLSDLLFAMIRHVNGPGGDILWVPGGDRTPSEPRAQRRRQRITDAQPDVEE